jgi:hypothetical protein
LADEIVKPDVEAVTMFRSVQLRVRDSIRQEPWLSYGALSPVWFAGRNQIHPSSPPAPASLSEAAEAWDRTKDATNIAVLEAFISRYKETYYADLARLRIAELNKQQATVATSPSGTRPRPHGNYVIGKATAVSGVFLTAPSGVAVNGNQVDTAVSKCSSACDSAPTCQAFDISLIHGWCSLYSSVNQKKAIQWYISGTRK